MKVQVKVTKNDLPKLADDLDGDVNKLLSTVAHEAEGDWKGGVRVDTGNLKSSIQTVKDGDGYSVQTNTKYARPEEFGTRHMRGSHAAAKAATSAGTALETGIKGLLK